MGPSTRVNPRPSGDGSGGICYRPMRRALVITLLGACEAAGLSGNADKGEPLTTASRRDPGTVVVGRPADAISLDPGRVTDNESAEICEQIYEALLHYQPGSDRIEPGLAESWTTSEDGLTWTFELRKGVEFHDGTPLTAEAVVFSLERQRDPEHPFHGPDATRLTFRYWENIYKNIRKVEATGPLTVRITLDRRYAPFEANMAMFPVTIVSPTAVAKYKGEFYRHPVGTGPFRFAEWEDGRIVLERNDNYWGEKPAIERLVFRAMPDGRERLIGLEAGAIDVAYSILPEELQYVELHPELDLHRAPANNVAYLAMNTLRSPFDDLQVRRAVNLAINKEPIVKLAFQGMAVMANGPLPPSQWGYHDVGARYPYDVDAARAALAKAAERGVFDPETEYRLFVPNAPRPYLPDPQAVAQVIQANLAAAGMKVDIVAQSMKAHTESAENGEHHLALYGWVGDNGDPDNFLYTLLDQDNTNLGLARNVAFFRNQSVHELLIAAQQTFSRPERERIYERAQVIIAEQAPWVPLAHSQVVVAARRDVSGIVVTPSTHVDFKGVRRLAR